MEQEQISVDYRIPLTGSHFFDTVIYMQAQDLARRYGGVRADSKGDRIIISGQLTRKEADALRRELDIDE